MQSEIKTSDDEDAIGLTTVQMKYVLEVSRLFAITADLENLLLKIARAVCDLLQCERASIWLHDPATDELYTTIILDSRQLRFPAHAGIVGAAFTSNRTINVPSAYDDPRFNPAADKANNFRTRTLMAVPMVDIDGKPVGVIQAVNKITSIFSAQDESLVELLAAQAGVAIQRHRLQEIAVTAAEMDREMKLARKVQVGLLPKELPKLRGFDLYGWAKSASITGGDCYDLWQLPDGRIGILLADASGHGIGPALVVSQARTLIRAFCDCSPPLPTPHEVLLRVHRQMSQDLAPERFVTVFLGFLDSDGNLDWQSAGHGPNLVRDGTGEPLRIVDPELPPINLIDEITGAAPAPLKLQPGGMLAVLSDGIIEAFNPKQELFGVERLEQSLNESQHQSALGTADALLAAVARWQEHDQPVDDQTIVLLKRLAVRDE
jgi:phosphoserine phosphatase